MEEQQPQMPSTAPVAPETPVTAPVAQPTPVTTPAATAPEQPKKKSNTALIIIGVIVAIAILCCSAAVGAVVLLKNAVQNAPQSVVVKEFFTAANTGDNAKIKTLTTADFYTTLTRQYDFGTYLGILKNNVESIEVTGINTSSNDKAIISFTLKLKNNQSVFSGVEVAEVTKDSTGKWVISNMGTGASDTTTPED